MSNKLELHIINCSAKPIQNLILGPECNPKPVFANFVLPVLN